MSIHKLKIKVKARTLAETVSNLIGMIELPTQSELDLCEELEEIAEREGGEFDPDNMSIYFEGKDASVTVFASVVDDTFAYQAIYEVYKPRKFTCGDIAFTIKDAIQSIK